MPLLKSDTQSKTYDHYMIFSDPPGPPQNPKVGDMTKTTCKLAWEPPLDDGGAPVLGNHGYRI